MMAVYPDHLAVPLITAVQAVLVPITDSVGVHTQSVTAAEVPGLGLRYRQTEATVSLT